MSSIAVGQEIIAYPGGMTLDRLGVRSGPFLGSLLRGDGPSRHQDGVERQEVGQVSIHRNFWAWSRVDGLLSIAGIKGELMVRMLVRSGGTVGRFYDS